MWSMDIASNALFDDRRLRALTLGGAFTREAMAIDVDQSIKNAGYSRPSWTRNPGGPQLPAYCQIVVA